MTQERRFELIETKLQGITETVQLIANMQRDNENRFAATEQHLNQLTRIIATEHESIKALERIALAHEQRLEDNRKPLNRQVSYHCVFQLRRSISIVIPAYNEEKRLPATLRTVEDYLGRTPWEFTEIVVVDDGSSDRTAESARAAGARVLQNPGNRGKGYSVRHGMLEARAEWLLFTDADLSSPIEDLDKLWSAACREQAQAAIGSRALDRSLIGLRQPLFREYGGRFFNLVMRIITGLPFRDTQCGFKLYSTRAAREVFSRQQLNGFSFDVEDLYIARRLGIATVEVPVRWANVEGTKVSALTGLQSFVDLARIKRHRESHL